jgi:hypothetical protein
MASILASGKPTLQERFSSQMVLLQKKSFASPIVQFTISFAAGFSNSWAHRARRQFEAASDDVGWCF